MARHENLDVTNLLVHQKMEANHFRLKNTSWEDLRFPAQGINPPGQPSDPSRETNSGLLLFGHTSPNVIAGIAQMPHAWKEGSPIDPHIHWQKTSSASGNVLWRIDYEVVNVNEVATMNYGNQKESASVNQNTPDDNTANRALITDIGEIDMTGKTVSCLVFWKVQRVGGNGQDTYGASIRLIEFDFHYQVDSFGSNDEYVKGV